MRDIEAYSGIIEALEPQSGIITLRDPCIDNHAIFRTLVYLERKASSKACQTYQISMHIQRPGIARTVYSIIFEDI